MNVRQSLVVWAGTLAVVIAAAAFAIRSPRGAPDWIVTGAPSARLPDRIPIAAPAQPDNPPFLIVVENTPEARPQSGLADACLVFVLPTEARITRFLVEYCDAAPKVIGPVRSARRYMLDIASDAGAILVHAGYSTEALALITARKLPVVNEFWAPGPFWRDSTRQMPHNLYTGLDRLRVERAKKPVAVRPGQLPFAIESNASGAGPEAVLDGTPAVSASLDYGPLYTVRYRYDAAGRRYLREQDGRAHLDADGRQIAPVSVLVLFVHWWDIQVNGIVESKIDTVGRGRLVILSGGSLSDGAWARADGGPLKLQDARGRPVVLPPGPVWIEYFPNDRPFAVQPETPR